MFKFIEPSATMCIGAVIYTTFLSIARSHFDTDVFFHTILSEAEYLNGLRLGVDTWDNISCAGKHAFVEEFVMGKLITARDFTTTLGFLENLTIENILYAYDEVNGETIILEANN